MGEKSINSQVDRKTFGYGIYSIAKQLIMRPAQVIITKVTMARGYMHLINGMKP